MDAASLGRLRWRCRRGMKELDVLLERYLAQHLPSAPAQDLEALETLLGTPDPLLYDWCFHRVPAPTAALRSLIEQITATGGSVVRAAR